MAAPELYGDNLTDLNTFMLPEYKAGLVDSVKEDAKLMLLLRVMEQGIVEKKKFTAGGQCYIGVKTRRPATGAAKAEGADVPVVGSMDTTQVYFNTQRVYATAGLTDEALDRAKGHPASYANLIDDKMSDIRLDMRLTLARMLYGDGTGRLARVASCTSTGDGTGEQTITFDNTRFDFGWAGTAFLRVGMRLVFYPGQNLNSNGIYVHNAAATQKVCTFWIESLTATTATGWVVSGNMDNVADNDIAYVEGEFDIAPNGLLNLVDDGIIASTGSINQGGSQRGYTFMGLDRRSYPFLQARIYRGGDMGGTDGTPMTWSLDILDQVDDAMRYGAGGGHITALYCNAAMKRQIKRKAKTDANIQTTVGNTPASKILLPGVSLTHVLINDRSVPVITVPSMPDNVIIALDERELRLYERYPVRFVERGGGTWFPSADRKHNYEAWMSYDYQLACERCDNFARIEDLLDTE